MFLKRYKHQVPGAFVYIVMGLTSTLIFYAVGGETNSTAVNNERTDVDNLGGKNKTKTGGETNSNAVNNENTTSTTTVDDLEGDSKDYGFLYVRKNILFALDVIGATCNILLVVVLVFDPLKKLQKGAWITILNLAITDFATCVSNFFVARSSVFDGRQNPISSDISDFFFTACMVASFTLLTLLTIQTYIIIKWPVRSRTLLTGRRIAVSCVVVWFLTFMLAIGSFSLVRYNNFAASMACFGMLELVMVIQVVAKILIIRKIVRSRLRSVANPENQHYKQREMAKTVMILNTVFLLTALPYYAGIQYRRYKEWKGESPSSFDFYYMPVCMVNFVVNPILYSLRLPDFRNSLIALFCNHLFLKKRATHERPCVVQGNTVTTSL